ncbi:GL14126 [Drosophila persimilis]|uniref:GL14126 n=1 Tax=Drosophila persimilis TaxID=7234 RepID=B4GQK5_DROPE|nr:GL14126 [Drosophila persimilis]
MSRGSHGIVATCAGASGGSRCQSVRLLEWTAVIGHPLAHMNRKTKKVMPLLNKRIGVPMAVDWQDPPDLEKTCRTPIGSGDGVQKKPVL